MLIVTGSLTAHKESFGRLLELSLAHVHRSRAEPGCISHAVHVDCENPLRLVFLERWVDRAALGDHFKVPETLAFVRTLRELASAREGPDIYEVTSSD